MNVPVMPFGIAWSAEPNRIDLAGVVGDLALNDLRPQEKMFF
jgi:hypothetical protein